MSAETTSDFNKVIIQDIPLMDVRAPVEFSAGAFPESTNMPIMDDTDRHLVGKCYKQHGREAAFALAFKRVSGLVKEERVACWSEFVKQHENAIFYCFRGGMRSKTAQQWLFEATGKDIVRLKGGYKALRRYLLEQMEPASINAQPVILGGRTGSGKTVLLLKLESSIDLEGLANHRGSAFGAFISPQPTQIDFENRLAAAIVKHRHKGFRHMILEDEGSYIGGRYIPHELAKFFKRDAMVLLETPLPERIETTYQEYVVQAQQQWITSLGEEQGLSSWRNCIENSVSRIRKRLGGLRMKQVLEMVERAAQYQLETGDALLHKEWIALLLQDYYDPMYDYQIEKSGRTILFRGDSKEVLQYFKDLERDKIG